MVTFRFNSMYGTYYIKCSVLQKKGKLYLVSYVDPISESRENKWVSKEDVSFTQEKGRF